MSLLIYYTLYTSLKISVAKIWLEGLCLKAKEWQDVKNLSFDWNHYDMLKSVANDLELYILYDDSSYSYVNFYPYSYQLLIDVSRLLILLLEPTLRLLVWRRLG